MSGALHHHAALVRSAGRFTDDQLVHMSSRELEKLRKTWGPPTINPHTGLPEYFLGDILGGIGDVVGAIGGGVGDILGGLFGGGSSSGSLGGLGDILSSALSLFGGGQQAPTMGAPQPGGMGSNALNGIMGPDGASGSGPNWGKLLNLAGGLASFVGALNRNNQWQDQQKKLLKQQHRQNQEWNQHVDYPIGQGNVTYRPPATQPELYGFGPSSAQVQYARGGRTASAGAPAMGALNKPQGRIPGPGTGQSDDVPALLSRDEYVIPADVVSHWGDGSSEAGAKKFDALVKHTRVHRTGNRKFPKQMGGLNQMHKMMGNRRAA